MDSGREDVDLGGETVSMSSSNESGESRSGSPSSDGDEGRDDGYDVEIPQAMKFVGMERGDEEGLRDCVRHLKDLVATLRQQWI